MSIKKIMLSFAAAAIVALGTVGIAQQPAYAACTSAKDCITDGVDGAGGNTAGNKRPIGTIIKSIVNALLFLLGAVAVIMIIIGGIKYTVSNGDSSQVSSAKNTIFYAVIGLIVAMMAYAIVNFVITKL